MQKLTTGGQCAPTGGGLLIRKAGSQLASTGAVMAASPASLAMLRMSHSWLKPTKLSVRHPPEILNCERVQARLKGTGPLVYTSRLVFARGLGKGRNSLLARDAERFLFGGDRNVLELDSSEHTAGQYDYTDHH